MDTARTGARYRSFLHNTAHAIRTSLFAKATMATFWCLRANNCANQLLRPGACLCRCCKGRDDQDGGKLATRRRRSTGPRTEVGKQRSKLNAVKYGIFSSVLLLGSESQQEFDSLVSGLQDYYQPVGTLEEALVDHLTASLWRLRRWQKSKRLSKSLSAVRSETKIKWRLIGL